MKRGISFLLLAGLILTLSIALAGEEKKAAKEVTLTGELVDTKCCTGMDKRGADHELCAVQCAKGGIPVGVLDEKSGKVYVLLTSGMGLADYMAKTVRVTGSVNDKYNAQSIIPSKLEVRKADKWEEVKLPKTMM